MKRNLLILFIVLIMAGLAWAGAVEQNDDYKFKKTVYFDGVIAEQTTASDGTSICFEGTTKDAFETCFLFTDPTADRTVTFGDSSYTAGATNAHSDIVTITKITTGTNTVQDAITMDISGADTTTGFGAGIVWKLEDDTGTTTEEHGSIDVVMTDATSTTEDSDMVFKHMVNGDVSETFRLVAAESATVADYFQFTANTTELNAEVTTGMFKLLSVGTELANLGATHEYWMVDAGGSEIQAEFAQVFTTVTDGQEDVDLVWRQNDNGTVDETLRIVADADGTTEGTRMEFTSRSAETDGVNDLLVLKASGGTTVANFGVGIDLQAEFADGVETACKVSAVWTDVGTGSEDADWVVECKDAGATAELFRATSDGTLTIASGGGFLPPAETVTNTNVIAATECGTTYYLSGDGSFTSTLPTASTVTSGCEFTFVSKSPPTGADIHSVTTGNSHENLIYGSVVVNGAVVACVAEDVVRFDNGGTVAIGDQIILKSDGAAWYLSGDAVSTSSIVCTTT